MATRAVLRFVEHTIRRHPDQEIKAAARCLRPECGWQSTQGGSTDQVDDECMAHTGRTQHAMFQRLFTDIACVVREDEQREAPGS